MAAFVKFSRGLLSTYQNLVNKDPNTLYLVYESTDSTYGSLYLGNKLISSVNNFITNLNDLADINIGENLEDGMLLQYNISTGEGVWEAVPLSDIIGTAINHNISFVENLNNIENPSLKDIAIIDSNAYIYNGSNWIQLNNSNLIDRISALENLVGHTEDTDHGIPATGLYAEIANIKNNTYTKLEVSEQIANAQHLKYQIVEDLSEINLQEEEVTNNTIFLIPKSSPNNSDNYDEYFVINGALEKIGSWDIDLSDYDNRLLTSEQKKKLDSLDLDEDERVIIQSSQVGGLTQAIKDNQLIKSVQSGTFDVTEEGELQLKSVPSIDLTGYVKTEIFNAAVGNLNLIKERVSNNSSLVDEINAIKTSVIWQDLISSNNG